MHFDPKSRRAFLKGAGGVLFALPFFPSFLEKAYSQTNSNVKRLISVFINSGSSDPVWYPNTTGLNFSQVGSNYKAIRMADIWNQRGSVSPIFSDSRLSQYAHYLNIYRGLDASTFSGHQKTVTLTGHSVGDRQLDAIPSYPSIDYLISKSALVYPTEPKSRLAVFGISNNANNWNGPTTTFSINKSGVISQVPPILNPMAAWDYYFKDLIPSGSGADQEIAKLQLKRKSILDTVLEDYKQLNNSGNLASSEKQLLESHMDLFRDLERKISQIRVVACGNLPTKATQSMFQTREELVANGEFRVSADVPKVMDLMIEIVATAMRCQLTNVATIMLDASNHELSYLGLDAGHTLSHARVVTNDENRNKAINDTKIMQALMISKVLNLVDKLNIPDPTNTAENMLDNTLIFGSNEMGATGNHRPWSMPVFTIGGTKKVNTGWLIDYRTQNQINPIYADTDISPTIPPAYHGRDYNSVLIGVMTAMGLSPADWEKGGAPGFGSYNFVKGDLWYKETESSSGGIITPGRRSPPPFMLK